MIKVIIVDDHPVVRRGLKQIIEGWNALSFFWISPYPTGAVSMC
jgi:YesN/AraC family two-component response regulator